MTDKPHTPTTDRIRDLFSFAVAWDAEPTEPHIIAMQDKARKEFDRWLDARDDKLITAAEQRGAAKALLRAERLMKEDRPELGETVSVKLIIDCHSDADDLQEQIAAAEQRGAAKALREFADAHRMPLVMFRGENYTVTVSDLLRETARIIEQGNRADQMEGDQ